MYTVLICDDQPDIVDALKIYLEPEGYNLLTALNGADALEIVRSRDVHLILLDIMMPGMDGIAVTAKIREFSNVPIILLTAKSETRDKVLGLNVGADDYITKPFGMMEMVSRVKAVMRRTTPEQPARQLRLGQLVLDLSQHTVDLAGRRVPLTYKEYELLKLFLSHPGVAFSRDQLLRDIWNTEFAMETRTVDMHIRTLRQKLGEYGQQIETVRGVGYRLEEKV